MKKVLAISGGVDSAALLNMFRDDPDAVVAHFDHGTRPSSADDAKFVEQLAKNYNLPFYLGHAKLGPDTSEEQARISRYEYFTRLCHELDGEIYTAHHMDDLIESIAINLVRGTGWRGLVPFGNAAIRRPFIETQLLPGVMKVELPDDLLGHYVASNTFSSNGKSDFMIDKKLILQYAAFRSLNFRQDPTNVEDKYLRNRLREKLRNLDADKKTGLVKLYHQTNKLKKMIDGILGEILPEDGVYERAWFMELDDDTAIEILRAALKRTETSATRPQLLDFLHAIRTYAPTKSFNLPGDKLVKFSKNNFSLK